MNTVKDIRRAYTEGALIKTIASTYKVAPSTVCKLTKDLPRRNVRIPPATRARLIKDYYDKRLPTEELCKQYGVCQRSLYNILTSRDNAGDPERVRSATVRLTLAEIRMLLSYTEGAGAFDRVRERLQKAMRKIEEVES